LLNRHFIAIFVKFSNFRWHYTHWRLRVVLWGYSCIVIY